MELSTAPPLPSFREIRLEEIFQEEPESREEDEVPQWVWGWKWSDDLPYWKHDEELPFSGGTDDD